MSAQDPTPIRLAIVNDYEIIVRGLEAIFSSRPRQFTVVSTSHGTVSPWNGGQIGAGLASATDILLIDPFGSRTPLAERIPPAEVRGTVKLVVLTWRRSPAAVTEAMRLGCRGYLSKGLDEEVLVSSVESIHAGNTVVRILESNRAPSGGMDWPGKQYGLTTRESEILALVASGLTNEEIASETYVGAESLKKIVRSAYRKIGVSRRSQAIVWCLRNGLVRDPDE